MRLRILYICLLTIVLLPSISWAEIIYLKDGRVVKGKIDSKDNLYTIVIIGDKPTRFYNSLIDRVESDALSAEKKILSPGELSQSTNKRQLIRLFLEANGTTAGLKDNFKALIEQSDGEKKEKLKRILNIDKIVEMLIPIYDKHFDEEELRQLIQFYQSPAGSKLQALSPVLLQETMETSVQYFKKGQKELEQ